MIRSDSVTSACVALLLCSSPAYSGCVTAPGGLGALCTNDPADATLGNWVPHSEIDAMTDAAVISIELASESVLPPYLGQPRQPAHLAVWCDNNTTSVTLMLGGWFVSDASEFGIVDYRIDGGEPKTIKMEADQTNVMLMIYGGKRSIPFVKSLLGNENLLVRATPFREQPIDMKFALTGIDDAVKPIREACTW